ncbi:MAG: aldolase/citrate lyase family protein [bacterium]|nr:aldolase/citrate lyase family protein [bacterium]
MTRNPLRQHWANGGTVINGWLHIPALWTAELMAHAGWDSLTIDLQHGFHSIETAVQMMQAISSTPTVPLVRVNWLEPGDIMRLLDAGAYGVICPMINTWAECEAFVGACRYPPLGYRSLGPTRARVVMGADYAAHANTEILTIAMVETKEAMHNLEAIASVDGLDMIFVGTGDLLLSLTGQVGMDTDDPQVDAALDRVVEVCARHDLIAGLFAGSAGYAAKMVKRGYRFVTVKTDGVLLSEAAQQVVSQTRREME